MTELSNPSGARKPLAESLPEKFGAPVEIGSPLSACAALCRALEEAKTFDDVRTVADDIKHLKLHGRLIRDQTLIADATVLHARALRKMGQILRDAGERGLIRRGRRKKRGAENVPGGEHLTPKEGGAENVPGGEHFTLEEIGISRKLSSLCQKKAALSPAAFEQQLDSIRERIISGGATTIINGDRAVMASRQQRDGDRDFSPTAPWATRALLERVLPQIGFESVDELTAYEPACGEGHMAEVLREYFGAVTATDIHDYGYGDFVRDFLAEDGAEQFCGDSDWIITNPPFADKAEAFALRAIKTAKVGVAILAQLRWLETVGRYERLFRDHPPTLLAFFVERVPLHMGEWKPDGDTATAYMWIVWVKARQPQAPFWIPPGCREALSKEDDRERFTAHPVISTAHLARTCFTQANSDEAEPAVPAPTPPIIDDGGGDDQCPDDDGLLDIPEFLRRTAEAPAVVP
jgi:hypothetical protein